MRVLSFELEPTSIEDMHRVATFMKKVEFSTTGCWLWRGWLDQDGYGRWQIAGTKTKVVAHRWAYEWFVEPIPKGLVLDHLCRVRNCVNPQHLDPCTIQENVLRGESLPAKFARKDKCPRGHTYSGTKNGRYGSQRFCHVCQAATVKRGAEKRKACAS